MTNTWLSIFTLYNYDPTLFDNMEIPPLLNKDDLVDNLIMELAEFEVLYTDPEFLKFAIEKWSKKELKVWLDLYDTTVLDYNPIENYNRTEDMTNTETRDLDKTNLETRNLSTTGSDNTVVDSENVRSGDDTLITSVSAYDEETTFSDSEKQINTLGSKEETDSTVNVTLSGTDTGTINTSMSDDGTITNVTSGNIKGNIGVTTTQQMIEQERRTVEFNMYDYIIESFKLRLCITEY